MLGRHVHGICRIVQVPFPKIGFIIEWKFFPGPCASCDFFCGPLYYNDRKILYSRVILTSILLTYYFWYQFLILCLFPDLPLSVTSYLWEIWYKIIYIYIYIYIYIFDRPIDTSDVEEWAAILPLSSCTLRNLILFITSIKNILSTALIPYTIFFHELNQKWHGEW